MEVCWTQSDRVELTGSAKHAQQGLLDFSREFDVALMDKVVLAFYSGTGQEVRLLFPAQRDCSLIAFDCTRAATSNKWHSKS